MPRNWETQYKMFFLPHESTLVLNLKTHLFFGKNEYSEFSEIYEKRFRKVLFWVDNSSCLVWTKGCKINQSIVVFTRRDLTRF